MKNIPKLEKININTKNHGSQIAMNTPNNAMNVANTTLFILIVAAPAAKANSDMNKKIVHVPDNVFTKII